MSIPCSKLLETFPELLSFVSGDKEVFIKDVSPAEKGSPQSILFISNEKNFIKAVQSNASVLVVPESHKEQAKAFVGNKTLLSSPNPALAMAFILDQFFNPKKKLEGRHPTAIVHSSAKVSPSAYIGPYVIVGENVVIADRTQVLSHVVIEDDVNIGHDTVVMAHVYIGSHTQIGNHCELKPHSTIGSEGYGFAHDKKGQHHRIPQRGIVVIEDNVSIGAQCTIDKATFEETRIGMGTKLDNMIHIAHNCKIGKHCLFAGGTMLAGSTIIGDHVVMGGQCATAGHNSVASQTQFGGRSGIQGNITEPGAYAGFPLQPIKENLRTHTAIKKLPALVKDVRKILKHLNLPSSSKDES